MSAIPEFEPHDDDDILAAELALGLLDDTDAATAQARLTRDPALGARVAWWQSKFADLADDAGQAPASALWDQVSARLPQNDNTMQQMQRWRAAAMVAMVLTAGLTSYIALRPPPEPREVVREVSRPTLVASIGGEAGLQATVAYDSASSQLTIVPAKVAVNSIAPNGKDAELWIIPEDGTPRSLGVINAAGQSHASVAEGHRALIRPGTTFAITLEPRGGSPTGLPTGPVVGSGKIFAT